MKRLNENDVILLTLDLFNAVPGKVTGYDKPYFDEMKGFVVGPTGYYALPLISQWLKENYLSGQELNKTFHKSWKKVRSQTLVERLFHQIMHYQSTYGTDFQGEPYIPLEFLKVPELDETRILFIRTLSKKEIVEGCTEILNSGIALNHETIKNIVRILKFYKFRFEDGFKFANKEANMYIIQETGVFPNDPTEFLRYVIFRITGDSLLIKSKEKIKEIEEECKKWKEVHSRKKISGHYNPRLDFIVYGLEKLAMVFNRHKKLFLAMKPYCPDIINRISKLSKSRHVPMKEHPLNLATTRHFTSDDKELIKGATTFAVIRAINACLHRVCDGSRFSYNIRNGKVWIDEKRVGTESKRLDICFSNLSILEKVLQFRLEHLQGKKFYFQSDVELAVPTSEKNFIGKFPMGTKFLGEQLAFGIYWRSEWGARDLDLSGVDSAARKFGWNGHYHDNVLTYSGDVTSAPDGAVEYLHVKKNRHLNPTLVFMNVYYGDSSGVKFKTIIGKGPNINKSYMMDPNEVFATVDCETLKKETILGLAKTLNTGEHCFTLINSAIGSSCVSVGNQRSLLAIEALDERWSNVATLEELVKLVGGKIVEEKNDADYDFSLDNFSKHDILSLLSNSGKESS